MRNTLERFVIHIGGLAWLASADHCYFLLRLFARPQTVFITATPSKLLIKAVQKIIFDWCVYRNGGKGVGYSDFNAAAGCFTAV